MPFAVDPAHRASTWPALLCAALTVLAFVANSGCAAAVELRGAQIHPLLSDTSVSEFDHELNLVREAGGNTVRMDISWSGLEIEGNGRYSTGYIEKGDLFFRHARARGIRPIVTLWGSPCWASRAPSGLKAGCTGEWWDRGVTRYPPIDVQDYADTAKWVANRWGGYMAGLQVWNEPNEAEQDFWKTSDPAGDYVALIKAAYPAIKSSRYPGLPVVGGALSRSDGAFLNELYDKGIKGYFDVFSVHPYTEGRSPTETRTGDSRKWSFISGVPWIRDIMRNHGDGKPIWLTEFGYTSCNDTASKYCLTLEKQAQYTTEAWNIVKTWDYVHAATQYNLRNKGTDPADREDNFGLVERDFDKKLAYLAFKAALTGDTPPVPAPEPLPEPLPEPTPEPAPGNQPPQSSSRIPVTGWSSSAS
jgi:hypothetical protein